MTKENLGFPADVAAVMVALTVLYGLLSYSPVIFSVLTAFRRGRTLERRVTFILVVTSLAYGLFAFALTAIGIPTTAFMVYVVPTLEVQGYLHDSWLMAAIRFLVQWWWMVLPPLLVATSFYVNRYLASRWNRIVGAARS